MRIFPILCALVIGVMLVVGAASAEPRRMPADAVASLAAAGEILLVDIRTPEEWRASGVAAPAHPLDMRDPAFPAKLQALMAANPGRPVALICATGGRSGFASGKLAEYGMSGVIDVSEGMFGSAAGPGWLKRGLPVRPHDQPLQGADAPAD